MVVEHSERERAERERESGFAPTGGALGGDDVGVGRFGVVEDEAVRLGAHDAREGANQGG